MKKIISILMTIVLTLTALSCTTAFAVDESTALEKTIINNISKMYSDRYGIVLTSFHQLSDDTAIYSYDLADIARSAKPEQTIIGKYKYRYADINQTYYFSRSTSYTLNTAYTSGMISDELLDEIAEILNFETVSEDDVFLKIREEIVNENEKINPDDITFFGVEFLSNNDVLFAYRIENMGSWAVMQEYNIGNYRYFIDAGAERFIYSDSKVVYSDSKVYNIKMAYLYGLIDDKELDEIAVTLSNYFSVYSDSSDVNGDGNTDVDDVTLIQKQIAGITDSESVSNIINDVDHDNLMTIDDVTLIQKYIAGLEVQYFAE